MYSIAKTVLLPQCFLHHGDTMNKKIVLTILILALLVFAIGTTIEVLAGRNAEKGTFSVLPSVSADYPPNDPCNLNNPNRPLDCQ